MKIAILVGAGATLAEALPSRPARKDTPPLDLTFFQLCEDIGLDGLATLSTYLTANYGLDLNASPQRMEEVFNIVYSDALSADPPANAIEAYWSLIKMYREAIRLTTNRLDGTTRYGVGAVLKHILAHDPDPDLTFITFNQDLVIERAIEGAAAMSPQIAARWDLKSAYEVDFAHFSKTKKAVKAFQTMKTPPSRPLRVLKLHGSMNWVYRVRSRDDAMNAVRRPKGALRCVTNTTSKARLRDVSGSRATWVLPVLVPPIYEKSSHVRDVLRPVWNAARQALEAADKLVVFGYSFPDADLAARNLLRHSVFANGNLSHVHVIDPASTVVSRVAALLRCAAITQCRDVPTYAGVAWT